jgi:hypothetical protein
VLQRVADIDSAAERVSYNGDMGQATFPSLAALGLLACVAAGCGGKIDAATGAGSIAAGGAPSSGGATLDGGGLSSGGGSSGAVAMGGTVPSGGATTGGSVSSGGAPPTGGAAVSGGMATGGLPGSGGVRTGGAATGGVPSGGAATGGTTSVPVCEPVTALPAKGTNCATTGQSLCQADGGRCVCERGIWYCNTGCDTTLPTPGSAGDLGTLCAYPSDVWCSCTSVGWYCMHLSGCPADYPLTGDACTGAEDMFCHYPHPIPAYDYDLACACSEGTGGSSWTCWQLSCPEEQPSYDLTVRCPVYGICKYGSTFCECLEGGPWICGLVVVPFILRPPDGGME